MLIQAGSLTCKSAATPLPDNVYNTKFGHNQELFSHIYLIFGLIYFIIRAVSSPLPVVEQRARDRAAKCGIEEDALIFLPVQNLSAAVLQLLALYQ